MFLPLKVRSFLLYLTVIGINAGLLALIIIFNQFWYVFAPVLVLGSAVTIYYMTCIVLHELYQRFMGKPNLTAPQEPIMFLVTAYNEELGELNRTIVSVSTQKIDEGIERTVVVIVDGTKKLGKSLLAEKYGERLIVSDAYEDWHGKPKDVTFLKTKCNDVNVVYIIKSENAGKRDSVVLARTLAYGTLFPDSHDRYAMIISPEMELAWRRFVPAATRMVGIDADTIFHEECTQAMLEEMNYPGKRPVDGVVGYIEIAPADIQKSPYQVMWRTFQSVGYVIGQHTMRVYQSRISEKVSCLSGACYAIFIPSMCQPELLREFNTPSKPDTGLFQSILSYASEDRRSVVLALCRDRTVRFRQALDKRAIAYTVPPESASVFFSQRRRWSLGTTCNNLWLFLYGTNLYISERIIALIQVFAFVLTPLYLSVNAYLIYVFVHHFDIRLVYISIPMMVVFANNMLIPLWSPCMGSVRSRLMWIPTYIVGFVYSPWIGAIVQANSLLKSWSVSWGKTSVGTKTKTIATQIESTV
ncbi:chitin synthase [Paramecium bursaria Chlorella virus CVR-1]|uniref:Chitin synthase n=1 Tax=Paramecium bursaria Chlorella virus CVA-1 TaxID=42683 RepID=M1GXX0_9PHYC|nr:chitin synthase [Paramecium bursaria Chlorella virus CVA-1]AGE50403.1 chitin synthase [Paramecium bursaria Chlorella virus CVA-1]AGE52080.1 chitin synthase [Paramecium bursaria Chlorella virus CVR-1]